MSTGYRVNYVAQIDPFAWSGGGEVVARALIEAGERLGHRIRRTCVFPRAVGDRFESPDFWLLADVHNRPGRWPRRLPRRLVERVIARERYVHFDNAYVDVCDLAYLPCNGQVEGDECPFKRGRWFRSRACARLGAIDMYRRAALNIFVSPLHQATIGQLLGDRMEGRAFAMRPVIDTSRFRNEGRTRDIEHLYLGHINEAKGADNLAREFPGGNLTLAGQLGDARYASLGRHLGSVPAADVPGLLNRARVFVHLPRWPEPQGRTVAEAALCGCTLRTNDRVGATSFGLDLADHGTYEGALEEAWDAIHRAVEAAAPHD
jgi:glycosyltransferase involved in cell wall biosynthesis